MHDAVALEGRGIPTAVIVTDAFVHEAELQRSALGAKHLEPVVIRHPLSTLTDAEIAARASQAVVALMRTLVNGTV